MRPATLSVPAAPGPDPGTRDGLSAVPWLAVMAATLAVHLAIASLLPLVQDEAYYALWATAPALGYYDHPPMIAWWIWLGEHLAGATPLGVRMLSVLAFAAVTPICWRIAARLTGRPQAGLWAAIFFNAMVVPFALGVVATPDAPSTLFWALATLAAVEAVAAREGSAATVWWVVVGLAAGLGVLSKLTNLFFWLALGLWLVLAPEGRWQLRRRAVWLGAVAGLVVASPYLIWNAQHDGLGLVRQFGRIHLESGARTWTLEYLVTTFVTVTPLITWAAVLGLARARGPARLLAWLMGPALVYLLLHSLHAQVHANWLAPLFPGIAVLAALGARAWPRWLSAAAATFGVALTVVALGLALKPGAPVFPGNNPPNQTKGWAGLSDQVAALAQAQGAAWIATTDYGATGELAFFLPGHPVWAVTDPFRYGFRGPFPPAFCDLPAILMTDAADATRAASLFTSVGQSVRLDRLSTGVPVARYIATPVKGIRDRSTGNCPGTRAGGETSLHTNRP